MEKIIIKETRLTVLMVFLMSDFMEAYEFITKNDGGFTYGSKNDIERIQSIL